MVREMKNSIREALVKSLPIFLSYICVAFGYAGEEENDKKKELDFRQADFVPVGSLILS